MDVEPEANKDSETRKAQRACFAYPALNFSYNYVFYHTRIVL